MLTPIDNTASFEQLRQHLHRGGDWAYLWTPNTAEFYTNKRGERTEAKRSVWFPSTADIPDLSAWSDRNVYFGVHPTAERGERWQRSAIHAHRKSPRISAINCVFGEFDVKDYGSKEALFSHLQTLPLYPSAIIDSGGGLHCYWLLDQPFMLDTPADTDRAKSIQYRWVDLIGSDGGAKDLARVLRVPGYRNMKPAYAPDYPTVAVVESKFYTYTIEQIEALLPVEQPKAQRNKNAPVDAGSTPAADADATEIEKALSVLPAHFGPDSYSTWFSVLAAVHSKMGDAGAVLCEKYIPGTPGEVAEVFSNLSADGGIGIGTLYHIAIQHGYMPPLPGVTIDVDGATYPADEAIQVAREAIAAHGFSKDRNERVALAVLQQMQHAGRVSHVVLSGYNLSPLCNLGHTTITEALRWICKGELDKYRENLDRRIVRTDKLLGAAMDSNDPYLLLSEDQRGHVQRRVDKICKTGAMPDMNLVVISYLQDRLKRLEVEAKSIRRGIANGENCDLFVKVAESKLGDSYALNADSDMYNFRTRYTKYRGDCISCTEIIHVESEIIHIDFVDKHMADDAFARNPRAPKTLSQLGAVSFGNELTEGMNRDEIMSALLGDAVGIIDALKGAPMDIGALVSASGLGESLIVSAIHDLSIRLGRKGIEPVFWLMADHNPLGAHSINNGVTVALNPAWLNEDTVVLLRKAQKIRRVLDLGFMMSSSRGDNKITQVPGEDTRSDIEKEFGIGLEPQPREDFAGKLSSFGVSAPRIISYIQQTGPSSVNEIAEGTKYTRATISTAIRRMTTEVERQGFQPLLNVFKRGRQRVVTIPIDWVDRLGILRPEMKTAGLNLRRTSAYIAMRLKRVAELLPGKSGALARSLERIAENGKNCLSYLRNHGAPLDASGELAGIENTIARSSRAALDRILNQVVPSSPPERPSGVTVGVYGTYSEARAAQIDAKRGNPHVRFALWRDENGFNVEARESAIEIEMNNIEALAF